MQRLVYSPKAYVYVRTEKYGIQNLSDYVVSGTVSRKVGMASEATIEIRNPDMIWTRGVRSGNPHFRPMDPITIWLQRIAGHPVQVFTGYLDQTPYLQLYPGTTTLTASCTLKRLLHTYWDPALPHVMYEFLAKYGWVSFGDGTVKNPSANQGGPNGDKNLTDGSLGKLLFGMLVEVADWNPKAIHIEELPDELFEKVADIYSAYNEDAAIIRAELKNMLKKYIGDGSYGGGNDLGGAGPKLRGNQNAEKAFNYFLDRGLSEEQAAGIVGNLMHESGVNPKQHQIGGPAYGIAQWEGGRLTTLKSRRDYDTLKVQLDFLWSEFKANGLSAVKSAKTIAAACFAFMNEFERPAVRTIDNGRLKYAQEAFASFGNGKSTKREGDESTTSDRARDSGDNEDQDTQESNLDDKIYSPFKGKYPVTGAYGTDRGDHIHSGIDMGVPCGTPCIAPFSGTITHVSTSGFGTAGGMIHLRADSDVAGLKKGEKIGWGHISAANVSVGTKVKAGKKIATSGGSPCHVHFVLIKGGGAGPDGNADPTAIVKALMNGEAASTGDAGDSDGGGGSASAADMLSTAKAAAFVQDLAFPGFEEQVEAMTLFGPRSLMNDQPLFPFVEQVAKAAMRQFMSLPNGNFYAFYPDYFGHDRGRKPYWNIDDIEILNMQIELTDEALATHVFAVGDINHLASPGVDWFDRMTSTGVVNIYNVTQSGFKPVAVDDANNSDRSKKDAKDQETRTKQVATDPTEVVNFLKRYGARPHLEEAGFVRNPTYEAFVAYQTFNLMWAKQFLTQVEFTFMPELFPGGLVGFPKHGLQCYIDQVDHTFSYADGFTTTAQLSAPASLDPGKINVDPMSHGLVRAG